MNVTGYILAGGKSSRFGSDKARATLAGEPLILRVAVRVAMKCVPVIAVADVAGKYHDLGLLTIADRRPGLGPLTGLETALAHRLSQQGPGWLLLVSCDLAALKAEWIGTILRQLPPDERDPASAAVAFRSTFWQRFRSTFWQSFRPAFWQPFPAAFHTDLLPLITSMLDEGSASFQRLLSDRRSKAFARPLPSDWPETPQVNTPEDLKRLSTELQDITGEDDAV